MLFARKQRASVPVAVFDVSSSSVGGAHALVTPETDVPATLLAQARLDALLMEELDINRLVTSTVDHIEGVAGKLRAADLHTPKHIQLVLAAPWYVSQTRTIIYKQDDQFTCTKKFFHDLVDTEIAHVVEHELEKFGGFGKEATVVEKQISSVKLNGYGTADPFGKKARSIEIFLTITIAPKQVIDRFFAALTRSYGHVPIHITTSTYATFVVARDYFAAGHEAVVIDVGEEVTDVAFVKDGIFASQHSFPVGSYGLYRQVIDSADHSAAEAEALVEAYRLGKAHVRERAKIDKAVQAFSETWRAALQELLKAGDYGLCLPDRCFVTADPRFEGVYPAIIATDPFIQHACSRGEVHATFIGSGELGSRITTLDTELDVPLATAVLFVARVL